MSVTFTVLSLVHHYKFLTKTLKSNRTFYDDVNYPGGDLDICSLKKEFLICAMFCVIVVFRIMIATLHMLCGPYHHIVTVFNCKYYQIPRKVCSKTWREIAKIIINFANGGDGVSNVEIKYPRNITLQSRGLHSYTYPVGWGDQRKHT